MGTKLFVGGLSWATTSEQLNALFAPYGTVTEATVITDRYTGRSRGFGFVVMSTAEEAEAAMTALNDSTQDGRQIIVNEAKEREAREGGSFGGRSSHGGGGDRGGRSYGNDNRGNRDSGGQW